MLPDQGPSPRFSPDGWDTGQSDPDAGGGNLCSFRTNLAFAAADRSVAHMSAKRTK